ncbi:ArcA-like protein [Colletotrichum truncatum]|uniref:ArcA-like protein n=1 Tax=Colletotrichum truncatum TaxID=5467 RepID=A0ACC3YV55_COLTU|nr:ArcA-like protein [Colletotrichum truncatum]KAF6785919.1 ArcA-like protein [Colletotrichum truncatum]
MCRVCYSLLLKGELDEAQVSNEQEEGKEERQEEEGEEEYCRPPPPPDPPNKTFVQPAPSHDGAPTFVAYKVYDTTPDSEGALRLLRPPFGIVVYDTTHTACPARSARLARALFDWTWRIRKIHSRPDRIEVVTLPLPQSLLDVERIEACTRHYEDESRNRLLIADKAEAASWFLPERIMDNHYARRILAINRFEDDGNNDAEVAFWEESLGNRDPFCPAMEEPKESRSGSFLCIDWQPRKETWQLFNGMPYSPEFRVSFHVFGFEGFGPCCMDMVDAIEIFYNHFIPDGLLDRQLEEARKA